MPHRRRTILRGGIGGLAGVGTIFPVVGATDDEDSATPATTAPAGDSPTENPAAVVSNHHRATEAGLEVLEDGGTAADAAVAVAAVLSVVEPWFSSVLGGGTWALYYDAEADEVTSLDGVGPVGADATTADYRQRGFTTGIHQAVVPGAWDGWMLWLDRYGTCELERLLTPAIDIARDGYPVSPEMERWLGLLEQQVRTHPPSAAIYERDGELLQAGDTVYQRDLAATFEALCDAYDSRREAGRTDAIQAARDYVYRGPIADAIVALSDAEDGYLTSADFAAFEAQFVAPVTLEYGNDIRVYQNPPNSQGLTMLLGLDILDGYDFSGLEPDDPEAIHLQAEAIKLAFADRYQHIGDPERVDVPVAELLAPGYAASQRDRIDRTEAMEWPIESGYSASSADTEPTITHTSSSSTADTPAAPATAPTPTHTTSFHIVDPDGNAAAVTTSLGAQFLVVGDTGVHINNRMRMIGLDDDDPNQLTPGYKVRHTSNPYLAFRDGEPYILGGNTGADTQPQGQLQQFLHVVEFGRSAQEAVARPRFVSTAFPSGTFPYRVRNTLQLESAFPDATIADLRDRGHDVAIGSGIFGAANMLVLEERARPQVGAEPRVSTAAGARWPPLGVEAYADEGGRVTTTGLLAAIDDWRADTIESTLLLKIINAWRVTSSPP